MAGTEWLEETLTVIAALSRKRLLEDGGPTEKGPTVGFEGQIVPLLNTLVERLGRVEGIMGAFASQEGLVMDAAGGSLDFDAFAAVAQQMRHMCIQAGDTLALGSPRQLVFSSTHHKLALFFAGDIDIGVVAPKEVSLARAIANARP